MEPDLCEIQSYANPKLTFDSVDYIKLSPSDGSMALFLLFILIYAPTTMLQVSPDADPNMITFFSTVSTPPPSPGTEYSVYFWDLNIRSILERLLPEAKVLRNSNQHTSTRISRPLYMHLAWRGEARRICQSQK